MAKPKKRQEARKLRKSGWSVLDIADKLSVRKDTVSSWCHDIELTIEQRNDLIAINPNWEAQNKGAQINKQKAYKRRLEAQEIGRKQARIGSKLHRMGCMLYWAEGAKRRSHISFTNTDVHMMKIFRRFLTDELDVHIDIFGYLFYYTQQKLHIMRTRLHIGENN